MYQFGVDDRIIEPADVSSRLLAAYRYAAPRVIEQDGRESWASALSLAPVPKRRNIEPARFDDMSPDCDEPKARTRNNSQGVRGKVACANSAAVLPASSRFRFTITARPGAGSHTVRAINRIHRYPDAGVWAAGGTSGGSHRWACG